MRKECFTLLIISLLFLQECDAKTKVSTFQVETQPLIKTIELSTEFAKEDLLKLSSEMDIKLNNVVEFNQASEKQREKESLSTVFDNFATTTECGNWHSRYANLHADILSQLRISRYVAVGAHSECFCARLNGVISAFYFSLITDRAFLLFTYDDLFHFNMAFDSPNINWNFSSSSLPKDVLKHFKSNQHTSSRSFYDERYQSKINISKYWPMYFTNSHVSDVTNELGLANMHNLPKDHSNVSYAIFSANRGVSYKLLKENSHHSKQLEAMGLIHPNYCAFCAFFYLFRPNSLMIDYYNPTWQLISSSVDTIFIGIHIRVGDKVFEESQSDSDQDKIFLGANRFFQTALSIAGTYKSTKAVRIYLASDSNSLKLAAKKKYGEMLLADTEAQSGHTHTRRCILGAACEDSDYIKWTLIHAAGEMLTLSLCHHLVISATSGYGRMAGWLSRHTKQGEQVWYCHHENRPKYFHHNNCMSRSINRTVHEYSSI